MIFLVSNYLYNLCTIIFSLFILLQTIIIIISIITYD
jgi:hypothetical protein